MMPEIMSSQLNKNDIVLFYNTLFKATFHAEIHDAYVDDIFMPLVTFSRLELGNNLGINVTMIQAIEV